MRRRWIAWMAVAVLVGALAGCSSGGNADLQGRLEQLEAQNEQLHKRVEQLTDDLRPLEKRIHEIDESNRHLEKAIVQAADDLRSQIHEMVQQERGGGKGRFVRPAPVGPERAREPETPRPYMGFDGQTITEELVRELKLQATQGVLVTAVREGAPAHVAGLRKDDVVETFDGAPIRTKTELVAAMARKQPGDVVALSGVRGGEKFACKLKLGQR